MSNQKYNHQEYSRSELRNFESESQECRVSEWEDEVAGLFEIVEVYDLEDNAQIEPCVVKPAKRAADVGSLCEAAEKVPAGADGLNIGPNGHSGAVGLDRKTTGLLGADGWNIGRNGHSGAGNSYMETNGLSDSGNPSMEADEALAACLNTLGYVSLPWMSEAAGKTVGQLTAALSGEIFQDPEGYDQNHDPAGDWLLRDQYLFGNVRAKLAVAQKMNRKYNGLFQENVSALKAILPPKMELAEIGISIGSPWIPASIYEQFLEEVLRLGCRPQVFHSENLKQWYVNITRAAAATVANQYTYGTERMTAVKIFEHTLNAGAVKIYDRAERPELKIGYAYVLNKEETQAAHEKQEMLQKAFREWVTKKPDRVKRLEHLYCEAYCCCVAGRFDGSFLRLPGLNPEVSLYAHQKNAVARMILTKDVLLNHAVGSGKTWAIIVGIHERWRMGLSGKNLIVVPNNVLEAFEAAHSYLYPQDPVLVIHPEEFRPQDRCSVLEKVRDGEFTAVYMAYSSFERISMSREYRLCKAEEEFRRTRSQAAAAEYEWEKQKLEQLAKKQGERLKKMREKAEAKEWLSFDELGITTLVVDEAHNFKNISLSTRTDGVSGMHAAGSKRCNALYEKAQYVRQQGGGIVFSTGTPITNSLSDLFVLQSFLQPEQLSLLQIGTFNAWVSSFAARRTGFEVDVDSQSFRNCTRFSHFHNLPELTNLFANVCDSYSGPEGGIGLPQSGEYIDTIVPKSAEQSAYIENLVLRTEIIRERLVEPYEDNLLKVTHDGRLAALDIRLTGEEANPDPKGTKVYACARNVYEIWETYPGTAQLVFCDLGTPKKGFHLYGELARHLVEMGVPMHEIAFIHDAPTDAKRRKLFAAVNEANVRVLIGSTAKLGMGVNVQQRLIALHHLDVPWKPTDITQREGRMIRQGNRNRRVFRYRYITAGTFDAYSWQILENKQRFIGQFMNNALSDREARDIDDSALTYAEIKALSVGDPLLKTRIETANRLERASLSQRQREKEMRTLQKICSTYPQKAAQLKQKRQQLKEEYAHYENFREKLSRAERSAFGEELLEALAENAAQEEERVFDTLHGCSVILPAHMAAERPFVIIVGATGLRREADMRQAKPSGCVQRIEFVLQNLKTEIEETGKAISRARREASQAKEDLKKGNPFGEEVKHLRNALLDIDAELERRAQEEKDQNGAA